ncbi:MAG: hypothetical protein KGV43_01945 [Arcobacter sp.]|nr:hypothetical protein [Arcobacter sp.]
MTTFTIDTDDKTKIDEFISLAFEKFNFKIKIKEEVKPRRKTISSYIDNEIKNSKSINTKKAKELKNALNGLDKLMDKKNKNLSVNQAKEQYFMNKTN